MRVHSCPECGAPQASAESLLGTLGTLEHHRCRYCGAGFERQRRARPTRARRAAACESCDYSAHKGHSRCLECRAPVTLEPKA